jgi:hypothetical protein
MAFFEAVDHNYFATDFHVHMFLKNLLKEHSSEIALLRYGDKIVRTGWPMEYMPKVLEPYKNLPKRNLILFPHRLAPEKQVEMFRDLATVLPEYEFIVCQDQQLTKDQYHTLLGQSKIVFSANLQETLGISCYEGDVVNSIPMVPDRLSYKEMYANVWKYPDEWTESWDSYLQHKDQLIDKIVEFMSGYDEYAKLIPQQAQSLNKWYFSATNLLTNVQ